MRSVISFMSIFIIIMTIIGRIIIWLIFIIIGRIKVDFNISIGGNRTQYYDAGYGD